MVLRPSSPHPSAQVPHRGPSVSPEGTASEPHPTGTLRKKVLASVGALVVLTLLGSTLSLYRITEVNQSLDAINRISVPLGRLLTRMKSDADILRREMQRGMGYEHWRKPGWQARPVPRWIGDVLESEVTRARELVRDNHDWAPEEVRVKWRDWVEEVSGALEELLETSHALHEALVRGEEPEALRIYPRWVALLEEWVRQLEWGVHESEHSLRRSFARADGRVRELRTGLEVILIVVFFLSVTLLWLGERALRPLSELTSLARKISQRGLKKEDKSRLPQFSLTRSDEVSQLAREFHNMATTLLEREKTVEHQKTRLEQNNVLLREMGAMNENILRSIQSVLIVIDGDGKVAQCNPQASRWLNQPLEKVIGSHFSDWDPIRSFIPERPDLSSGVIRLNSKEVAGRIYGGQLLPLTQSSSNPDQKKSTHDGMILVLEDLTDQTELQNRLRLAENLATVGRMSAQVAHEVRNPLHSIGLEAEMALEMASKHKDSDLKLAIQSILAAVDRLDTITENYLKLTRPSAGERAEVNLGDVLQGVIATYGPLAEKAGIRVDWQLEKGSALQLIGDRDLLEQAFGNLMKNAIQAFPNDWSSPKEIRWKIGLAETDRIWIEIEDTGPGIDDSIRDRLFSPFVTTKAQGTGLGLPFIRKVMEQHGGKITVLDNRKGACFQILLPKSHLKMAHTSQMTETSGEEIHRG